MNIRSALLCIALLATPALADETIDGINYRLTDDGKAEVSNNRDCRGDIVIPGSITFQEKTYQVTSISNAAFFQSEITSITLPDGLTTIEGLAFCRCYQLESIVLPASMTNLDGSAFLECLAMRRVDCLMTEPTAMRANEFSNPMKYFGTLHVPSGCRNAYRHAMGWKDFVNIVEDNEGREMVDIHIRCNDMGSVLADGKQVKGVERDAADLWFEIERGSDLLLEFVPEYDFQYSGSENEVTRLIVNSDSIPPLTIQDNKYLIRQVQSEVDIDVTFELKPRTLCIRQGDGGSIFVRYDWSEAASVYILPNENAEVESAVFDGYLLSMWETYFLIGDNHYNFSTLWEDKTLDIRYKQKEEQP